MGGIPGAKFTIMRTVSMIVNLISVILVLVFIGTGITNAGQNMALITGPLLVGILLIGLLKVEFDFVDDHRPLLIGLTFLIGIILDIILGLVYNVSNDIWLYYIPMTVVAFAIVIFWHYTLTIYKDEKKRYYLGFLTYIVLWLGFGIVNFIGLLTLVPAILSICSVGLNFYAEKQLLNKKLLKFI